MVQEMIDDVRDLVSKIRLALCDPDAPWYGSDVVPWVADLCDSVERLAVERDALQKRLDAVIAVHESNLRVGMHESNLRVGMHVCVECSEGRHARLRREWPCVTVRLARGEDESD